LGKLIVKSEELDHPVLYGPDRVVGLDRRIVFKQMKLVRDLIKLKEMIAMSPSAAVALNGWHEQAYRYMGDINAMARKKRNIAAFHGA
jgi:hypothetical protein